MTTKPLLTMDMIYKKLFIKFVQDANKIVI